MIKSLVLLSTLLSVNAMAQYGYGQPGYQYQCMVRPDNTNICIGDHVIAYDTNPYDGYTTPFEHRPGVVREIYSNYVALVEFDNGGVYTVDLGSLAREVPSLYGYDRGDRVRLEWKPGRHGTVYAVYENGEAYVSWDSVFLNNSYVSIDDLDPAGYGYGSGYPVYFVRPYDYTIVSWRFGPQPMYGTAWRHWDGTWGYYNYGWFPGYYYPYSGVWFVIHPAQPRRCGNHTGWNYGSYPYGTKGYDYGVYNRRGAWGSYGSGWDLNGSRRSARGYDAQTWNNTTRGGQRIYETNVNRGNRGGNNSGGYNPNTNNGNRGDRNSGNNGGYTPNTNNGNRGDRNSGNNTPNTNNGGGRRNDNNSGSNNRGGGNSGSSNNGGGSNSRGGGGNRGGRG